MKRHTPSGRLVIIAGVAIWLSSPAHAQPAKVGAGKESAPKDASAAAPGALVPKVSILRLQVIKPEPPGANTRNGYARRRAFGFPDTAAAGTSLTFLNVSKPEPEQQPPGRNPFNRQAGPEECTLTSELDPAGHTKVFDVTVWTAAAHLTSLPSPGACVRAPRRSCPAPGPCRPGRGNPSRSDRPGRPNCGRSRQEGPSVGRRGPEVRRVWG